MSSQLKELKAKYRKMKKDSVSDNSVQMIGSNSESCFFKQLKESSLHPKILKQARKSGCLNLSGRGLAEVPDIVWNLNSLSGEEVKALSVSLENSSDEDCWWDYVDLTKLIIACNALIHISPEIKNHHALTVLDLHDNRLSSLPDSVAELCNMSKIDISRNQFKEIPQCIFQLKMLLVLFAQHNVLHELNGDIGNLSVLEELDLSNNKLKELPACLGFLSHVTVLNVSHNELIAVPYEIGDMCALKRFEVSNNQIAELPEQISNLRHVEQIYVQYNRLVAIPPLTGCTSLKELHCGFNCIKELSVKFIEALVCIKLLDFRDNKISEIPDSISWLQTLEMLHLPNNNISSLPYTLGTLPHLKVLSIDGNPMRTIRRDIIQRGTVHLLKWLRSRIEDPNFVSPNSRKSQSQVDGTSGSPREFDVFTLRSTKTLNYSNKDVSALSEEVISNAVKAEVSSVDLSKNNLDYIPSEMDPLLPNLIELKIGFNRLSTLTSSMGLCSRLQYLDIRNNKITDLPAEISSLHHLREINLSFNKLQIIPEVLFGLTKLEILIASNNQISEINVSGLSNLPMLSVLDLHDNSIKSVPPELGNVTQLRSLLLDGNLFRNPRPAVLSKGTLALLQYLRMQIPQDTL